MNFEQWNAFLKKLEDMGYDISDPKTTLLLRPVHARYSSTKRDPLHREVEIFYAGRTNKGSSRETIEDMQPGWAEDNLRSLRAFEQDDLRYLSEFMNGDLILFDPKDLDPALARVVYWDDEGKLALSATCGEMSRLSEKDVSADSIKIFNSNERYRADCYDTGKEFAQLRYAALEEKKKEAEVAELLRQDQASFPEIYRNEQTGAQRRKELRGQLLLDRGMQAQLQKEYPDEKLRSHTVLGKEKALETQLQKLLGTEDSLCVLLKKGQLRKVNGEKFTLTDGNEYADFCKLVDYLESGRKVLTYKPMPAPSPIDPNRMTDTCVGMVQQRENGLYARAGKAAVADNDYTKVEPEDLEPVEASEKLKTFAVSLLNVLEEQVGLNALNYADGVRLKGFFPPKQGESKPQEVNMLDTFAFAGDRLFPRKTDAHPTDLKSAAKELNAFTTLTLGAQCLKIARGKQLDQEVIHQLYAIMAAAESGNLTVTGHGEMVSQSRPITVDDSGKAVLGAYGDSRHRGCEYARQSRTKQENEGYLQGQQTLFEHVGAEAILSNASLLLHQDNIPNYAAQLADRGIPLQEAVQQILQIRKEPKGSGVALYAEAKSLYETDLNELDPENPVTISRSKPGNPSRGERTKRKKLSEAAMAAIVKDQYEVRRRLMDLRDAVDERTGQKCLTRDEYQSLLEDRALYTLLMQPYRSDDERKNNLELTQLALGHGVKKDSPEHKKMYAVAINQAMERVIKLDAEGFYEQYIHLNDEQLVANWQNYRDAGLVLMEIKGTVREQIVGNPYIDEKLLKKCSDISDRYAPYYNRDCNRMDYIANIQYELFDISSLENAPYEETRETLSRLSTVPNINGETVRMSSALYSVWQQKDLILGSEISIELEKVTGVWHSDNEFYKSNGEKLDDITEAAKVLRAGETLFVCPANDAMNLQVISMGKDQKIVMTAEKDLPPEQLNARNKLRNKLFRAQNEHMLPKDAVMVGSKELVENAQMLTKYLMDSESSPERKDSVVRAVGGEIAQYFRNVKPKLTCEEFLALSGGKKIPAPSKTDMSARSQLSHTAVKTVLQAARLEVQANSISKEVRDLLPSNQRFTITMMLRHDGPQDVAHNEGIIKGFFGKNATREEKTTIIENLLREHLKGASLINREYTDKELVENWQKIHSKVRPMGVDYENFMGLVQKENLKLDEKLLKECAYTANRMGTFMSVAQFRMQQITNPYYRYGNADILKDTETMAKTLTMPDMHIRKLGMTTQALKTSEAVWALMQAGEKMFPGVGFSQVRKVGAEETLHTFEEPEKIVELLRSGVPLEFISADGAQTRCYQMGTKGDMKLLEGASIMEACVARATSERESIYEKQLMSEMLSQNEKRMIDTAHTCQLKLQEKLLGQNVPLTAEEIKKTPELKTAFAEWIVSAVMVCNYVGKGLDEITMAELSQPGRVKGHAEELLKSPLLTGEFLRMLPKDPVQVVGMTNQQIFGKLAAAQESLKQQMVQNNSGEVKKTVVNNSAPVKNGKVK